MPPVTRSSASSGQLVRPRSPSRELDQASKRVRTDSLPLPALSENKLKKLEKDFKREIDSMVAEAKMNKGMLHSVVAFRHAHRFRKS